MSWFYLDSYYGCKFLQKSEILAFLQELLLTERSQAIRNDILQLLGDYCGDLACYEAKFARRPASFCPISSA